MRFNAHISYNGDCEEAFGFYRDCLGGEITLMMRYGSSPSAVTYPELSDKIVHATLKIGDQTLTGADVLPTAYERPAGFAMQLNIGEPDEARRVYSRLAEGATIAMSLQKTFWAGHYAVLTDRFGTPWEINCA